MSFMSSFSVACAINWLLTVIVALVVSASGVRSFFLLLGSTCLGWVFGVLELSVPGAGVLLRLVGGWSGGLPSSSVAPASVSAGTVDIYNML